VSCRARRVSRIEDPEDLVDLDRGLRLARAGPPSVVDLLAVGGSKVEVDEAVRDARQRRLLDHRPRPPPERRVVVVHREADERQAVVGNLHFLDGPDLGAGDLHEVALDELVAAQDSPVTV
jgi:hypothetical protein